MREIKLKYLCESFAGNLALKDVPSVGQYPVFGASGRVGFLDSFGIDKNYLGIIKDGAGVGRINEYPAFSNLLGTMAYIVPKTDVSISWLKYAIFSLDLGNDVGKTTIPHIYFTDYGNRNLPYITKEQQEVIAKILDEKTAQVDALIANQEAQIEKLKAYKQSLITEVVTKGLDKDAPMKDSGVEWIGMTPASWTLRKVKDFIRIENGSDPKTCGDIPVYGSGAGSFKTCGEYKMGPTVLIGRKGATLHIPHYIEGKYWNADTAFNTIPLGGLELKLFYYLAMCFDYSFYKSQTTLPGMTQTAYNNMIVPIPPLDEQKRISSYLDDLCTKFENLIGIKCAKIEKLNQYKQSLIFEYVTGKKEIK